jgi:subtilisin family serine protease
MVLWVSVSFSFFVWFSASATVQESRQELYLVVLRDDFAFRELQTQILEAPALALANTALFHRAWKFVEQPKPVQLIESLAHVRTLVVQSDSTELIAALKKLNEVLTVEPVITRALPFPVRGSGWWKPNPDQSAVSMGFRNDFRSLLNLPRPWGIDAVRAPQAWAHGAEGQGVRVLVIDTGVDREHPVLASQFEAGKDFVGDNNKPYEDADKVGHGTHVAATLLGAQLPGGFSGVAPKARLLSARVCSMEGCTNLAVARGINWGIEQKVQVMNLSLGGEFLTNAENMAIEAAEQAGIVVVAAAGNDGVPKVSFPAALPSVIAVGAIGQELRKAGFSQWGPQLDVVAPGVQVLSAVPQGTGRESSVKIIEAGREKLVNSVVMVGSPEIKAAISGSVADGGFGRPEELKNVNGRIALISRGQQISFGDKVKNAIAAGAVAVLMHNNEPGLVPGRLTADGSEVAIPALMIEQSVGENLRKRLQAVGPVQAKLETIVTDYSSLDGTSMASPHVAGVVALALSAKRSLTPPQVRQLLKTTATPLSEPNTKNEWGAGLVNAEKAVTTRF